MDQTVHQLSLMPVWIQQAHGDGPLWARQPNVIWMLFHWRADGGPLLDVKWEEPMPTQDSDQTVLWIQLWTVDNKTSQQVRT